jgi:micrococcal nuclease
MKVTRCLLRCGHIARCACRSLFAARSIRERRGMIGKDKLTCLITTLSVYALLLPTAGLHVAHAATAEVIAVHDGDTLDVTIQGEKVRIRLYGIDAPERGQHGNVSSTRFLKRLVFEHPLEIRAIETDVFGRTLAIILLEGRKSSVNAAIVANGYAWVNPSQCIVSHCKRWKKIESQARKLKLGIWSGFDLVPPWEFQERERN